MPGSFLVFDDAGYSLQRGFAIHGLAGFLEFSLCSMTTWSVVLGLVRSKFTTILVRLGVSCLLESILEAS